MQPTFESTAWIRSRTEMSQRLLAHDWASTSLGPLDTWPESLRSPVQLMLQSKQPMSLAWGPDLRCLYNEGFIPMLGSKHPDGLGLPFRQLWAKIADEFEPMIQEMRQGYSHYFEDRPVALAGGPGRPVGWFTFSWTPLYDENNAVQGFFCVATESTDRVIEAQKLASLKLLMDDLELMTQTASWEIDMDTGQMVSSDGLRRIFDLPADCPEMTPDEWRQFVHPDEVALRTVPLDQLFGPDKHLLNEFRIITARGETRWLRSWVRQLTKADGSGTLLRGLTVDLTYRKTMEQGRDDLLNLVAKNQIMNRLLKKDYDKLEMTLEAARLGLWELNPTSQKFVVDSRLARMLGEDPTTFKPSIADLQARIHPDDVAASLKALEEHLTGNTAFYETEYRIRHSAGHWIWLLANGRVVKRDDQDSPSIVAGTVRETTQQKRQAEQGVGLLQQIKQLLENMGQSPQTVQTLSPTDGLLEQLTKRQRQMLELIAQGRTTAQIAETLHISTGTAFTHRRDLMRKLNLRNTAEVTTFAIRHGLIRGG